MIFEFMGIPGSGKTTLHGKVESELRAAGYSIVTPATLGRTSPSITDKYHRFRNYIAVAWRWRTALRISGCILLRGDRSNSDKIDAFRLLIVSLWRYGLAHRLADDIVLMDEGFAQRCFMILVDDLSGFELADLTKLIEAGPIADILIHVVAEPSSSILRLTHRDRGMPDRFEQYSHTEQMKVLKSGHKLFVEIAGLIEVNQSRNTTVITIDSNDDQGPINIVNYITARAKS